MAQAIFNLLAEFSEALAVPRGNKKRIIAKTSSAARLGEDRPFAGAVKDLGAEFHLLSGADWRGRGRGLGNHWCQSDHAAEPGGALLPGNIPEQTEEFSIVFRVGAVPGGAGIQSGEAGGVNAGGHR